MLWVAAIKVPMYSVGVVPIVVSAAAAYYSTGVFVASRFWMLIAGATMIIAWLNLSNDAFDAETGVDKSKAESVVNLTGNQKVVLAVANGFLVAGGLLLHSVTKAAGDAHIGLALALAVCMGYLYQGPPFRLSYKGLGEPLCFLAYGPLATSAFFVAQAGSARLLEYASLGPELALSALLVGLTTTSILFCSHFHQIEGDTAAGKMSPLVRLGTQRGYEVLRAAVIFLYMAIDAAAALQWLPLSCCLTQLLSVPAAMAMLDFAKQNHAIPEVIRPLKKYALKWHMAVAAGLALGFAIGRAPASAIPRILQG
ncbi:hypothetical protein CVIRNUC_010512 [Coccomyxa viridis]|uniref:1,4-dihydroxy-2-naphthoate octaprenyltransferase n=1 Tax=Coccomyxa viridis TaxID=1274662 RepID=A0AAV1IMT9_9CHLO|nr:hypothetical protein CVIRNUC_010512 [Coccomyxa viridis]